MNSFITEVMTEANKVGLAKNNTKKVPDYMLAIVEVLVIKISANNSKSEEQNAKIDLLNAKIDELIAKHASEIKVRDDKLAIQENIVSYLKDEVKLLGVNKLKLEKDISSRDEIISQLDKNMTEQQFQTDNIGQYNRRDNIKIIGVPYTADENLIEIAQNIATHIGVNVDNNAISAIHRLPTKDDSIAAPSIIMRLNRRTIKHELMDNRKNLRSNPHQQYPNIAIYEDVTPL